MTDKLLVTGSGWDDLARFEVGPESEKEGEEGRVAFGMGAEVSAHFGFPFGYRGNYDEQDKEWEVTLSQGGIGGQSLDTARIRADAFSLAVQIAERFAELAGDLEDTETLAANLAGTYYRVGNGYKQEPKVNAR